MAKKPQPSDASALDKARHDLATLAHAVFCADWQSTLQIQISDRDATMERIQKRLGRPAREIVEREIERRNGG